MVSASELASELEMENPQELGKGRGLEGKELGSATALGSARESPPESELGRDLASTQE